MNLVWTLVVAAVTALVTAITVGLVATPRLDARKKRIGDAHAARDTFGTHLLTVLAACTLLRLTPRDDPEWTPVLRERVKGERARWLEQLDDSTRWMVDHVFTYAGSWPLQRHKNLAVSYATNARGVFLSERQETTKLELLVALTTPVQRQFFGFWWSRARHHAADQRAFDEAVARLTEAAPRVPGGPGGAD
ncbi:hypothetical protein QNN03_07320 [Streptomyces sp. GXMU-J15]|uniref:DUF4760 domain-containing protein n=1 Tax=Streptomyces fuscus TaxID=3048495 RepID=A0ABT7IXJ4_9ACTN|nr:MULTISPECIES: hypothetical protein [Streptomyces]MDL2076247.1 hypothetical protein [Streptomyces fuscus]SBT94076.1 hypothetical protein GA0115233_107822 [Streptomyces sp. DI166]